MPLVYQCNSKVIMDFPLKPFYFVTKPSLKILVKMDVFLSILEFLINFLTLKFAIIPKSILAKVTLINSWVGFIIDSKCNEPCLTPANSLYQNNELRNN